MLQVNTMVTHMTPDDASVSSEVDCLHLCSAEESCSKPVLASFFLLNTKEDILENIGLLIAMTSIVCKKQTKNA